MLRGVKQAPEPITEKRLAQVRAEVGLFPTIRAHDVKALLARLDQLTEALRLVLGAGPAATLDELLAQVARQRGPVPTPATLLPSGLYLSIRHTPDGVYADLRGGCGFLLAYTVQRLPDAAAAQRWAAEQTPQPCRHIHPQPHCWRGPLPTCPGDGAASEGAVSPAEEDRP